MTKVVVFLLCCTFLLCNAFVVSNILPNGGKIWALLVAGSNGYYNYRHQSDVCHAYQLLHSNGIPNENIIVMMADDVAYSADNPTPGIIVNAPGGPNVYEGVPKDYTGTNVNPSTFLNVMSGNKTGVLNIGSGRVIESGPNDHLFVNFVDHGGPGVLCFSDEVLTADVLISTLVEMAKNSQFSKLFLYIEACHAGSLFDDMLQDDLNILVMTAADPHESSYACYYDEERQTYLGDVFSVTWLNDSEHESLPMESVHHQFEKVRTFTNTSHVEEYGDLDIGATKVSEIIGFRMKQNGGYGTPAPKIKENDVVSNIDVPLDILNKKLMHMKDSPEKKKLKLQKHRLLKKRSFVDNIMEMLVKQVAAFNDDKIREINESTYRLGRLHFPCYKASLQEFSERCFNVAKNPYVRSQLQKLVNMCSVPWLEEVEVINAIKYVCHDLKFHHMRVM